MEFARGVEEWFRLREIVIKVSGKVISLKVKEHMSSILPKGNWQVCGLVVSSTEEEGPSMRMDQSMMVISIKTVVTEKVGFSMLMELSMKEVLKLIWWKASAPWLESIINIKAVGKMARWKALEKVTGTTRTRNYLKPTKDNMKMASSMGKDSTDGPTDESIQVNGSMAR